MAVESTAVRVLRCVCDVESMTVQGEKIVRERRTKFVCEREEREEERE